MVASFTTRQYNHTSAKLLGQSVDLANLKVMLLDENATFDATRTTLSEVSNAGAYEVYGSGWGQGGELFANAAVSVATTDDARLQGDDIMVRATGGIIGPASALVLYDASDANDAPLFHTSFSEPVYAGEGTEFRVPGLILTLTYTAP